MRPTVRIIGGKHKGKKLHFPDVADLRPTPDRVKETLFNWLMHDIREANCLDAFAGSGALGFEAYSRGAKRVVLIEASPKAYKNLLHLASLFNAPNLEIIHTDVFNFFNKTTECFDIIFLDPPFAQNYLPECMKILACSKILRSGGLVYVESADKFAVDVSYWQQRKLKKAGQVVYGLYEKR